MLDLKGCLVQILYKVLEANLKTSTLIGSVHVHKNKACLVAIFQGVKGDCHEPSDESCGRPGEEGACHPRP